MTDRQRRLAEKAGKLDKIYGQQVNKLIRKRYTAADEIAILRQRDEKPDEYAEYCAFAEACKEAARAIMESV